MENPSGMGRSRANVRTRTRSDTMVGILRLAIYARGTKCRQQRGSGEFRYRTAGRTAVRGRVARGSLREYSQLRSISRTRIPRVRRMLGPAVNGKVQIVLLILVRGVMLRNR